MNLMFKTLPKSIDILKYSNNSHNSHNSNNSNIRGAKQIGKILREEGLMIGNMEIEGGSSVVISNLKLIELPLKPLLPLKTKLEPYRGTNRNFNGNSGNGGLSHFIDSMRVEENQENVKKNIIFTKTTQTDRRSLY